MYYMYALTSFQKGTTFVLYIRYLKANVECVSLLLLPSQCVYPEEL